ncbi:hypothetical protein RND71_006895 [Anisodus tanguticus]|uniref:Uncharacterized protein n=1 Tax=Anisodus tanguticus TaxID=243964 RepID=A0AAE1SV18_9SOLA|nr:hypothetical protein RND71_006895 [Anisodus tanguticus]
MKRELNELYNGGKNEDVHGFENINMVPSVDDDIHQQPTDFDPMDDTDIWLNGNFSTDFPLLQDFQCMSPSSSTSNSPPNESDPSCWTVLKSDVEHNFDKKINVIGDQECQNVMGNEFLDPISFFHSENQQQKEEGNDEQVSIFQGDSELALMFLEWLKQNKDYISAEDMRSIKLKRSTIESASKRLGSTKEGKKQLLRLILDWVEQHRLQKKQMREAGAINQQSIQNSAPYNFDPYSCFYPSQWMATPAYNAPFPYSTCSVMEGPIPGYIGDPYYSNGSLFAPPFNQTISGNASSPASAEYQPMDTSQSWSPSQCTMAGASQYNQFPDNDSTNNVAATDVTDQSQALFSRYPYQLFDGNGERLARLGSSATKEARKNRMARQRRLPSHHYRHQTQNQRQINDQSVMMGGEINCATSQANNSGNWVYWPSAAAPPMAMVPPADPPQAPPMERPPLQSRNHQKHGLADKRQNREESKISPAKSAEAKRCWQSWKNCVAKDDFVQANGLQEGDFIVIYADIKCGKYLLRGVKVRQNGPKSEGKQPAKKNLRKTAGVSSAPVAQAVR